MFQLEIEKALIEAEQKFKLMNLKKLEDHKQELITRAREIEIKMEDCQVTQSEHQDSCKKKLQEAQENLKEVEEKLSTVSKISPEYDELFEQLLSAQESLDNERKNFEDLEFHHLEEEADWLASREEIQREILDITQKMDLLRTQITELDQQKIDTSDLSIQESKTLERKLLKTMQKLENYRDKLKTIEENLRTISVQESDQEISSDSDSEKMKDRRADELNISVNLMQNLSCSFIETSSKLNDDDLHNMSQSFNEKMLHEKSILDIGICKCHK